MGRRRSIFMKLLLSYSIIIIVSFFIFITFFVYLFHNNLYSERETIYNHQVEQWRPRSTTRNGSAGVKWRRKRACRACWIRRTIISIYWTGMAVKSTDPVQLWRMLLIFLMPSSVKWPQRVEWSPQPSMSLFAAISLIIGANVSQWVIASDYTRYAHPRWKDSILIPLGIVGVGIPLFMVGAIMSVGVGDADIVNVMLNLGFPVWGFLILWLATWTSQLVNNYSMGLAFSNLLNVNSNKGRQILTLVGTLIAIAVALAGILDYFEDFLYMTALVYPAIAGVMFADFFFLRNQTWKNIDSWNYIATIAAIIGIVLGYYTQYVNTWGIPAVQSLVAAFIAYYL